MTILRNKWLWVSVGAYLLFLLITMPASLFSAYLSKRGIQTSSTDGSIWHGQVTGLRVGVLNLGNAEWHLRLLPLFTAQLGADIKLTQPNGFAQARLSAGLTGKLALSNLSASLPLQTIMGSGGLPGGWVGTAQAKFSELVFNKGWPIAAQGSVDVIDLTGPARQPANIGAYRVTFAAANTSNELNGKLESLPDAAMDVIGTLKLSADRSYQLDTLVATRPNTPTDIVQSMQYLGSPDAQGRRPFSVSGTM